MRGFPGDIEMPFYEYQCSACGDRHEALQKLSDEPLRVCPACGASALERLISAPSFRLKGGGWYETDFKSDKQRNLASSDDAKPTESKSDAGADKKGDKKADKKADKPAAKADKSTSATAPAKTGSSE